MSIKTWVHNACLILGLIFVVLGARLYFKGDIGGLLVHFALGIALFLVALFSGRNGRDSGKEARSD